MQMLRLCIPLFLILFLLSVTAMPGEESKAPVAGAEESAPEKGKPAADGKDDDNSPAGLVGKLFDTFSRGGAVMYVLLGVSVVGLTFALERLFALRSGYHVPAKLLPSVEEKLKTGGVDSARLMLKGNESALAKILDGILARKGANREEQERILEDEACRVLWDMRLLIRPVGIVASVAPLIGLLGTVFGLISAFQKAAELGMDDPRNFASGIYEALYTTAFGLTVAIPFLLIYHYLRGKADVIIREAEDISIAFIIDSNEPARDGSAAS
ncbi:MAG: MotA/TolQ/ExbB proton channel family protein [Planctomycetes bacterium]|nr:MotA/TolQ/ExbB proton channel family protein [Planctomycetota bacterium]